MHIKATAKYHFISNRIAKVKILPKLSVDKGMKAQGLSYSKELVKSTWA